MNKLFLPLFWKFVIGIVLIVAIFGSINIHLTKHLVYESLENEIQKRGFYITRNLAERVVTPIMYDDIATLYKFTEDIIRIDSNVMYAFILNKDKEVIAHNFDNNVPIELINANKLGINETESVVLIKDKDNNDELIRDFAIPILNGEIGIVRVGLSEKKIQTDLNNTIRSILIMIILFLVVGIISAFLFALIITTPIKLISKTTEEFDINSFETAKETNLNSFLKFFNKIHQRFRLRDEIDVLSEKFDKMLVRLNNTYTDLQTAQTSLLQTEKMSTVGTLSAGIIHEINNPIAGIQNCIHRISRNPENIKQNQEYIEMMNDAINKVENVLKGVLNYSRKHDLQLVNIDFSQVITNVLNLTSYQLEKSNILFHQENIGKDFLVSGSSNHLEQVLLNLLLNSIYAVEKMKSLNPEHQSEIFVKIFKDEKNFYCAVEDNGIGIETNILNNVFNPFFTTKGVDEGTGLGLSICYNIIEAHGGNITVTSKPGVITIFTIQIPLKT
jgi:two-component system NtrC family sensor kinase